MATELHREVFQRTHPRRVQRALMDQNVRADGRRLEQGRSVRMRAGAFPAADGSAIATLGRSHVMVTVSAFVAQPHPAMPGSGRIEVPIYWGPLVDPKAVHGKEPLEAEYVSDTIKRLILSAGIIDLSELCIESGKAVWLLCLDITVLSIDGSLLDVCWIACWAALKTCIFPRVEYIEGEEEDWIPQGLETGYVKRSSDVTWSLQIEKKPVPILVTFAHINNKTILDPNRQEVSCCDSIITLALDTAETVYGVFQPGGSPIGPLHSCITNLMDKSKDRVSELTRLCHVLQID